MLDIYLYENQQLLEQLEGLLLEAEKGDALTPSQIDETFRIMHTIKGSSSMMSFDNLYRASHSIEDLFSQLRDREGEPLENWGDIFDLVLDAVDFIKLELQKLQEGRAADGDPAGLIARIQAGLRTLKGEKPKEKPEEKSAGQAAPAAEILDGVQISNLPVYKVKLQFEEDCQMEHIRSFAVLKAFEGLSSRIVKIPAELETEESRQNIAANGFIMYVQTGENPDDLKKILKETLFLKTSSLIRLEEDNEDIPEALRPPARAAVAVGAAAADAPVPAAQEIAVKQNFISVNVNKLDSLLDLVGELVTTEAMVTKNPELEGLQLDGFETAARQLRSLTTELQEIVMSMRMLPLSTMFHKMQRLVRDTSKKLSKEVNLTLIGEETEVDKNIIDNLSDPLMHLIRNSVDHGIESPEDRRKKGKPEKGNITLEAKNVGEDVIIIVSDDGKGLDRQLIIEKSRERGLIDKEDNEISDKEAFSYIFLPGFSTKEAVTEFSGRGVGMDVVRRYIEKLGGFVSVESEKGKGTSFIIRIPLTLAIVDGMRLTVGPISFIAPMASIREAFVPDVSKVFSDPEGNEMIMIRGECYPILRLNQFFNIESEAQNIEDGILVMIESDSNTFCVLVDRLLGEQQVVVKPLPEYIQKSVSSLDGISGCTILGDGKISLIMNVNNLFRSDK